MPHAKSYRGEAQTGLRLPGPHARRSALGQSIADFEAGGHAIQIGLNCGQFGNRHSAAEEKELPIVARSSHANHRGSARTRTIRVDASAWLCTKGRMVSKRTAGVSSKIRCTVATITLISLRANAGGRIQGASATFPKQEIVAYGEGLPAP